MVLQEDIMNQKEQIWGVEKDHLNNELKYAEEMAIEAKLQYADVATDKDMYEARCKALKAEIEKFHNLFLQS